MKGPNTVIVYGMFAFVWGTSLPAWSQVTSASVAPDILEQVGIEQRLDETIPLDLVFRDETGQPVPLSAFFRERPVVLSLVYYDCPMLCTMILNGLLRSLKAVPFDVGKEYEVVTVSFDPRETPELARRKKKQYVRQYDRPGAAEGWHFLTGEQAAIDRLTEAVGFHYTFDEKTQQFVHASGIMVLTPDGTLSRYFYGIEYAPRDLKLGLVEASAGRVGSVVDQLLLYCYHYDPETGKYGVAIMNITRILGTATVLAIVTFMVIMLRQERRKRKLNLDLN